MNNVWRHPYADDIEIFLAALIVTADLECCSACTLFLVSSKMLISPVGTVKLKHGVGLLTDEGEQESGGLTRQSFHNLQVK